MTITSSKNWFIFVMTLAYLVSGCASDDGAPTDPGGDTTGPMLTGAAAVDRNHVRVTFNEDVDGLTAEDPGNYAVDVTPTPVEGANGAGPVPLIILTAVLVGPGEVLITSLNRMTTDDYTIMVRDVEDLAGNAMSPALWRRARITCDVTLPQLALRKNLKGI